MRTSLYSLCIAIIAVAFLNGCDEIQSPYKRNVDDNNNNNNGTYIRKVFIEDYTGYRCGNCPRAAEEASRLLKTYDTNIVVLALHTGSIFARPFGSKFKQDFRTEAGEQLFTDFIGNAGQPNGTINRAIFDGQKIVAYTGWEEKYLSESKKAPLAWIDLQAQVDDASGEASVTATITALEDLKPNTTVAFYLVEDSIFYWQTDYRIKAPASQDVEIYHRHVMRGTIGNSGAYGESISAQAIKKGTKITKTQSINLKDSSKFRFLPDPKHCGAIAIVADPDTREVLQVQEIHFKK
jgi:hypothetical protein